MDNLPPLSTVLRCPHCFYQRQPCPRLDVVLPIVRGLPRTRAPETVPRHTNGHHGDETLVAITCAGTDV